MRTDSRARLKKTLFRIAFIAEEGGGGGGVDDDDDDVRPARVSTGGNLGAAFVSRFDMSFFSRDIRRACPPAESHRSSRRFRSEADRRRF